MFKSFDEIHRRIADTTGKRLAVAGAAHASTLKAVAAAREAGIAEAVLIGPEADIRAAAEKAGVEPAGEIIDVSGDAAIAACAVEAVREGRAGMVMKGAVSTGTLLKAALDKNRGLRSGKLLSHIAAIDVPGHERMLWITDGGMNIDPDLPTKAAILGNAVNTLRGLGYERPTVAVLGAVEKVNPDMTDTLDAASLTQMGARGQFGPCEVDGPLAIDLALSEQAGRVKGLEGAVIGKADVLLTPEIRSGNILAKGLLYLAGARVGGMIAGAAAPIIMLSRADDAETKLNSIALCTACAVNGG